MERILNDLIEKAPSGNEGAFEGYIALKNGQQVSGAIRLLRDGIYEALTIAEKKTDRGIVPITLKTYFSASDVCSITVPGDDLGPAIITPKPGNGLYTPGMS